MKMTSIALICVATILSGCATYVPPVDRGIAKEKSVSSNFDTVWQNATDWFANNNVPIKNIVKDSGLIATDYKLGADSSFIDCGTVGTYEVFADKTVNLNVLVKEIGANEISVRVNVFGTGVISTADLYGNSTGRTRSIDCVSTGKLETEMFSAVTP